MKTPRSPYEKVAGLYFLGRTIDKIRFRKANELRPDFYDLMGKGFDGRIMAFLELDYTAFAEFVSTGASDEQCADYVKRKGRPLNDVTTLIWNDFAAKRGWKDSGTEVLEKFKAESGLSSRTDIQTLFEYWEVDEGRKK